MMKTNSLTDWSNPVDLINDGFLKPIKRQFSGGCIIIDFVQIVFAQHLYNLFIVCFVLLRREPPQYVSKA